jgi:hypothetical protein
VVTGVLDELDRESEEPLLLLFPLWLPRRDTFRFLSLSLLAVRAHAEVVPTCPIISLKLRPGPAGGGEGAANR